MVISMYIFKINILLKMYELMIIKFLREKLYCIIIQLNFLMDNYMTDQSIICSKLLIVLIKSIRLTFKKGLLRVYNLIF